MSKHTPGPWRVEGAGPYDGFKPIGGCGCCGSPWINGDDEAQEKANARLIAAAPDLLAACIALSNATGVISPADMAAAKAAIAKATGEA